MNGVLFPVLYVLLVGASACTFVVSSLVDDMPDAAVDAADDEVRPDTDVEPGSSLGSPCVLHRDCDFGERPGFCIPDRQGWPGGTCAFVCDDGSREQCDRMGGICENVLDYWPVLVEGELCLRRCMQEQDCRLPDYGCRSLCREFPGGCTPPLCAPTVVGSPCSADAVEDHCHWGGAVSGNVRCLRELSVDLLVGFNDGYCSAGCATAPESCGPNADCVRIDAPTQQLDYCLDRCSESSMDECRWNYSCRNMIGLGIALDGYYCVPDAGIDYTP